MTNFNNDSIDQMKDLQEDIAQMQKEYLEAKARGEPCDHSDEEDGVVGGRLMEQLELLMVKEKIEVLNQKIAAIMSA